MPGLKIGIDLGTSSIKIFVRDKGIVLCEPAVVAYDAFTMRPVAVGKNALNMLGKTPDSIKVKQLMTDGSIFDYERTEYMIRFLINKICGNRILKPTVVINVSSDITALDKRALADILKSSGAGKIYLMEEPLAAALGSGFDYSEADGTAILDIGAGTTDSAVVTMNRIAVSKSTAFAGNHLTETIMEYIANERNTEIGFTKAEHLKKVLGGALRRRDEIALVAGGKNTRTGLPTTIEINSGEIYFCISESLKRFISAITSLLSDTPPELVGDISDNGIILTGGTAEMTGLGEYIFNQTKIPVKIPENASLCVINGIGKALAATEKLEGMGYLTPDLL